MRASRSRTREATNLLTSTPDEAALAIACAVLTAKDLLSLALTCKRFSAKCIAAGIGGGGGPAAAQEMLSIAEEAARRWVAGCSEQERGWVPRRERASWLGLMHDVEALRLPLAFARAHASITLSENGALATRSVEASGGYVRTAASTAVMRSGRHFAQFVAQGDTIMFGVIRPGWHVGGGAEATWQDGHCFYYTYDGRRLPAPMHLRTWEGMRGAVEGDRMGLLLDLDQGSMAVWKNGVQLGVMVAEGLSGPLCWAVSLYTQGSSTRIESAPAPPSPTEDELAAARA